MPKIIHQRKKCIGCGACMAVCPKFFELDKKDGLATLKNSHKAGENFTLETVEINCAGEAADVCPVKAIEIKE